MTVTRPEDRTRMEAYSSGTLQPPIAEREVAALIITEIVGDMEIPCDYSDHDTCPKEAAAWILHRVSCSCGMGGAALACTPCKDMRLLSEGAVTCGGCGEVTAPAKHAYSFVEPISRPR